MLQFNDLHCTCSYSKYFFLPSRQFMYDINLRCVSFIISSRDFVLFSSRVCVSNEKRENKINNNNICHCGCHTWLSDVFIRLQNWQTATCQKPKLINTGKCSCLVGLNVCVCAYTARCNTCTLVFTQFGFVLLHACDRVQRPWTVRFAGSRAHYLSDNEICSLLVYYYSVCVHMLAWQMQWFMVDHLDYIIVEDVGFAVAFVENVSNHVCARSFPRSLSSNTYELASSFFLSLFSNCTTHFWLLFFFHFNCKQQNGRKKEWTKTTKRSHKFDHHELGIEQNFELQPSADQRITQTA